MELQATKPIAVMAVILDPASRQSEVIDVDRLRLYALVVNHQTQSMIFAFVWGGYASTGKFFMSTDLAASHRSLQANVRCRTCTDNPATETHDVGCEYVIWQNCANDAAGNPILDHGTAFVEKVMIDYRKIEDIVNGGWNFRDGLDLTYQGATVFTKPSTAVSAPPPESLSPPG